MPETYRNILIVRTDRIGDVILTTPALKALHDAFPDAKLSILVSPATKDLVDGIDFLDEVLVDDRQGEHKGLFGYLRLIALIRQRHFDLAVIYHTKKRTNAVCFLADVPLRIGYKNDKFGFLLTKPIRDERHLGQKHEAEYCLDLLKGLGIASDDLTLYLPVKNDALGWADGVWKAHGLNQIDNVVAVHGGASDPAKQWPAQKFAEVIETVSARYGSRVILVGSPQERGVSEAIIKSCQAKVINLTGQTTLAQLAALLSRCRLMISNDSGPVHMAAAVGTPVVSIFTRNQPGINPERWRPLGTKTKVVSVDPAECAELSFQKAGAQDPRYLQLIPAGAVLEAVDALFKLC